MGTWNTEIKDNDTFQDIYQNFFDLYNQGQNPTKISKQILEDFAEMFIDHDDRNNCLFGLAFAQWETKSLDSEIYNQVKEIIESGNDLEIRKELGADDKMLKQRKIILEEFLAQISATKEKPKRRVRPKFDFAEIEIVNITAPDNLKTFEISEEYVNNEYVHTGGILMWGQDGGSILYFTGQREFITAEWIDNKTLEIIHDKNIVFEKKDESAYYNGDNVKVIYKTMGLRN